MKVEPAALENAHIRLEPLAEAHREPLRRAGADPELWRFHFLNQHGEHFDRWFDWSLQTARKGETLAFAIRDRRSGEWAGSSSYLGISPMFRRLEIGSTWYAKPYQGGAMNPAAKHALMQYAFEQHGAIRVEFKLDRRNARSWAAMRKLGATEEGILRHHMLLPDGHRRDSVYFSVLEEEWPRVKAGLETRLAQF